MPSWDVHDLSPEKTLQIILRFFEYRTSHQRSTTKLDSTFMTWQEKIFQSQNSSSVKAIWKCTGLERRFNTSLPEIRQNILTHKSRIFLFSSKFVSELKMIETRNEQYWEQKMEKRRIRKKQDKKKWRRRSATKDDAMLWKWLVNKFKLFNAVKTVLCSKMNNFLGNHLKKSK